MKSPGVLASNKFRGQEVQPDLPGITFLESNAKSKLFYDFSRLTSSGFISNGDPGLEDQSPGSNTATIVNTPSVRTITINSINVPTLEAVVTNGVNIGSAGEGLLDEDFELFYAFQIEDGLPAANQQLFGAVSTNGIVRFEVFIATSGKLLIRYRTTQNDSRWDSTAALLPDGVNSLHLLRIKYDFTNNVFGVWLDESPVTGQFVSGSISSLDPTDWTPSHDVYVGTTNIVGTVFSNSVTKSVVRVAITDILTDQEAADVSEAMTTFGGTPSTKPAIQASTLVATPGQTSIVLSWTGGNGTNKMVVGKQGSPVDAQPVDGIQYTPNAAFGAGSELGTGNFVLFGGTINTVTITGLTRDTLYYFDVYEFNASGFRYLTTIDTNTTPNGVRTDYINDQDFSDYATDYTEHQTVGFTTDVQNGELTISGNPKGYQDYVEHNDWDETLEEFELEIRVRLDDELTSDTIGIGLGIKNDLDNEANRGVFGLLVTTAGSGYQGRVQLYSGNGQSDPTNFSLKQQSSGLLTVAEGNTYKIRLKREVTGNDAVYTTTVINESDESQVTASWTETGRPSSAFYATTIRSYIYQNGGTHAIDYFIARRTGDEGGEVEPPPAPEDFDIYVALTGSDGNPGTIDQPLRSNNAGLIAIAALGGSGKKLSTGPGTFIETSFLNPPANLGLWRGAGAGVTVIKGSSALYTSTTASPSRSSDSRALVAIENKGNVDMTIQDISFRGDKDIGLLTDSMRHCFVINNTHGVKLKNIYIGFFNTTGLKLGGVNDFLMEDFFIESSAGETSDFDFYEVQTFNVGGGTPIVTDKITDLSDTNYRVIFKNGTIDGRKSLYDGDAWSDGAGWGMTGGGGNERYITNVKWENVTFLINKKGLAQYGINRFPIEGLYMALGNVLIRNCYFQHEVSWGGMADRAHNLGPTRMTECTWAMDAGQAPGAQTLVMEMQISDVEVDHCYVRLAKNGVFASINDQDTFGNAAHAEITRGNHGNWDIHHNVIELNTANNYGMFGGRVWSLDDIKIRHNTIVFTTSQGVTSGGLDNWYAIFTDNDADGGTSNLVYENNIFLGIPPNPSRFWDDGGMTNGIHRNNFAGRIGSSGTPFNVAETRSGVTSSNNVVLQSGSNTLGLVLGTPPTNWDEAFNGNYYRPRSDSPIKNQGTSGSTPGALDPL